MRYCYERGVCYDEKLHKDLDFEQTVKELEEYRDLIKVIQKKLYTEDSDSLIEFIEDIRL